MHLYVIDTETYERDGVQNLRLLTWRELGGSEVYVVDALIEPVRAEKVARKILQNPIIGHNLKFDFQVLWRFLGEVVFPPSLWDTMISQQVLDYANQTRKNRDKVALGHLAQKYLGVEMDKSWQTSDWSGKLSPEQIEYAKKDVEVTEKLYLYQRRKILPKYLKTLRERYPYGAKLYRSQVFGEVPFALAIENACVPVYAHMEYVGVGVDKEALEERLREVEKDVVEETVSFKAKWGVLPTEKQKMAKLLGLKSVKLGYLKALENPSERVQEYIEDIERYNHIKKERDKLSELKTYLRGGRVHPSWWQIGAPTGRVACSRPNVQNLPRGSSARRMITAEEGKVLIVADFSQIELRIASVIVPKFLENLKKRYYPLLKVPAPKMKEVFARGQDAHRYMAAIATGKRPEEITKEERQLAKGLNFGLLYGQTPVGFRNYLKSQYGIEVSEHEAIELVGKYYTAYPEVGVWHRIQRREKEFRVVCTLGGRLAGGYSRNDALNYPIQGTGADLLKLALVKFNMSLRNEIVSGRVTVVMTVHDEIVVEADEEIATKAEKELVSAMVSAGEVLLREVPAEVEVMKGVAYAKA